MNTDKEKIFIKGKVFSWDSFTSNDKYFEVFTDSLLINISNDTVYLYDATSMCDEIWAIGNLKNNKTLTLSNECGSSTIINHLTSKTSIIDTLQNEKLYTFSLSLGTNGDLESKDLKRNIIFSKERGIITFTKNDTIIIPPFW